MFGKTVKERCVTLKESREVALYVMPSTSPAYATMTVHQKTIEWHRVCFPLSLYCVQETQAESDEAEEEEEV